MKKFQQWNANPNQSEAPILLFLILGINAFLIISLTEFFTIHFFQIRFIFIHIVTLASILFVGKVLKQYVKGKR
jgi:hypothetical protein